MDLHDHGRRKYGTTDVLQSSVAVGWSGIAAELRHHPPGELPSFDLAQTEIGIATRSHRDAVVRRRGGGVLQSTAVVPGTIWTCPAGVREEDITLREWHECLHVYLPSARFVALADARGGRSVRARDIRYLADVDDPLIRQIAWTLLDELQAPTPAGRVLVETLALCLTARLVQAHADSAPGGRDPLRTRHRLDDARLARVIAFMDAHIEREISIDDLAAVACLSPFHFIRMFRNRTGVPPHRFLGRLRIEHAKALIARGDASLYEIALTCCFSSQANFTRAFTRAAGMTPGAYRRAIS